MATPTAAPSERIEESDGDITYIRTDKDLPPVAIIDRSPITTETQDHLRRHRGARRARLGDDRVLPRGDRQRGVVRDRRDLHLRHRLPLLRAAHRDEGRAAARRHRHARRASSRTAPTTCRPTGGCCSATTSPRSPAPARSSGPCWPPRWATCPGTIWIIIGAVFAGCVQDYLVLFDLDAPRRPIAGPDGARRDSAWSAASPRSSACSSIMMILLAVLALVVVNALAELPVGRLLDRDDDPDRALHGLLPAHPAARPGARRPP